MAGWQEDAESLSEFESYLCSFAPRDPHTEVAVLMFRAGQASVAKRRGTSWIWPATCALSTLVASVLALALWWRPVGPPGSNAGARVSVAQSSGPRGASPVATDAVAAAGSHRPTEPVGYAGSFRRPGSATYLDSRDRMLASGVAAIDAEPMSQRAVLMADATPHGLWAAVARECPEIDPPPSSNLDGHNWWQLLWRESL